MKKVLIEYNPYEMRSRVVVDNKEIQSNQYCDPNLKRYLDSGVRMPIQAWVDPIVRDGWDGLLPVLCKMGDKDINIEFIGRAVDYENVKQSLLMQNEKGQCEAKLKFELSKEIISDEEMKHNIDDVVHRMLNDDFSKMVDESHSPALINKYGHLKEAYEEIRDEEFRIVFTGTYSSGKSSTINCLIGKNLLPTASGTCTANVCRIIHSQMPWGIAKVAYCDKGIKKEYLCKNEEEVQDKIKGANSQVQEINVYTDLSNLYPDGIANDFKIVLIDTPGTDSATGNDKQKIDGGSVNFIDRSHLEITKEVLKSKKKEMAVLISDDKLEDENIVELMDIIEESADNDEGFFNDRFLFVMNKCDSLSYSNSGESLDNNIENFVHNIKKVPNSKRIRNIVTPRVFPISSGVALAVINGFTEAPGISEGMTKKAEQYGYYESFCKKVYYYDPNRLENDFDNLIEEIKMKYKNYSNYCLEEKSSVSAAIREKYRNKLSGKLDLAQRVLIHSGVPALKDAIREYIRFYAYPLQVRQLLNCFVDIIGELKSLNINESAELEKARKYYSNVVSSRQKNDAEEKDKEIKRQKLNDAKVRMANTKKRIDEINENLPFEANAIRSRITTLKKDIASKFGNREWVPINEANGIISDAKKQAATINAEFRDTVWKVKQNQKNTVVKLYQEYISYVHALEKEGLMNNGSFSLQDTVAYKQLIDKNSFTKEVIETKNEKNPQKKHVEFGLNIGKFFSSVPGAWKTRKLPNFIEKEYVNVERYVSDNITPIEAEFNKNVVDLKNAYKEDIRFLKNQSKLRVEKVIDLINQQDQEIARIKEELNKLAADEEKYNAQILKLQMERDILDDFVYRLEAIKI